MKYSAWIVGKPSGRLLLWLGLHALFGCTLLVDPDRKPCSTSADCRARGPAFSLSMCVDSLCQPDPVWACANEVTTETQAAIRASLTVTSLASFAPLAGVQVSLCGSLDLSCANPLASANTDSEGNASFDVPAAFGGYAMLEGQDIMPVLFFPDLPIQEGESLGNMFVSPRTALEPLAAQLGDVPQPGRGLVVVQVFDCEQQSATGTTLEVVGSMSGSRLYYAFESQPSPTATFVDESGIAGILNAVPGTLGLRVKKDDATVGQASVLVRDGFMSFRALSPGLASTVPFSNN